MNSERSAEPIALTVDFPKEKGISLCWGTEHAVRAVTKTGGNVTLTLAGEVLATIAYSEEFDKDFTLEGYERRAKSHAENIIARIVQAANIPAAKSYEEVFEEKLNQASSLLPPLKV